MQEDLEQKKKRLIETHEHITHNSNININSILILKLLFLHYNVILSSFKCSSVYVWTTLTPPVDTEVYKKWRLVYKLTKNNTIYCIGIKYALIGKVIIIDHE